MAKKRPTRGGRKPGTLDTLTAQLVAWGTKDPGAFYALWATVLL
jgi:hypothetical protein